MTDDLAARYRSFFELAPVTFWEQDFTETMAGLEALAAAGVRDFRAYFLAHPEVVLELARKTRVIDVNRTSLTMFGARCKKELIGSLDKVFLPETYPMWIEQMTAFASGESLFVVECLIQTLQGRPFDALVSILRLPPERGVTRGLVTILDISQRKQAERESRAQEKLYRTLAESIPHLVWMADAAGRITYCNQAMREATRLALEQARGRGWLDVVQMDDIDRIAAQREVAYRDGRAYQGESRYRCADGSRRIIQYLETPVEDEHGHVVHWVGLGTDITELKEAQQRIQQSLERSNRELAQIAYAASHDLQEPLRMISSYADLLQRRQSGLVDEKTSRYTSYMVEGADRIRRLIDDLASLSSISIEDREPAPVQTRAVVAALMAGWQARLDGCGGQIVYGDLPDVMADRRQLTQLFLHLFDNSLKFRGPEPPRIEITVQRDGAMHRFAVRDNGMGFDSSRYGELIFGMFQRLHAREHYPGTGIGLTLARKIVERNGGRIWVASQPGAGATFFFTMPAVPDELAASRPG